MVRRNSALKLKLIKSVHVEGSKAAQAFARTLHNQFNEIRLAGEWFKAENSLLAYIDSVVTLAAKHTLCWREDINPSLTLGRFAEDPPDLKNYTEKWA